MSKFIRWVVAVPVAILILLFAIANRQDVAVSFDPFAQPGVNSAITAPLFLLLFAALIVGTFVGGVATWMTQGRHRRRARDAREDAERWRDEARRLREQPPTVIAGGRALARSNA